VAVAAVPAAAAAHPAPDGDGLDRVRPEVGPAVLTHGVDPMPKAEVGAETRSGSRVGFDLGDEERPPVCAPDYRQHVLYAQPTGATSRFGVAKPHIQAAMRRMNAVLNAESLASGGGTADFRVLCDGAGQVRVDSFVSAGSGLAEVIASARLAGFAAGHTNYTIFYDGQPGSGCGVATFWGDERPIEANLSNQRGGYAVVYRDCWFNEGAMHEIGHNMGAVQYSSPHSTGTGAHCNDEADAMCYSPDGGDRNQSPLTSCADAVRFDCGFDDYFDTAPEPGEYLATHWNLGSPLNRFLNLGPAPAPSAEESWEHHRFKVRRRTRSVKVKLSAQRGAPVALYVRARRPATDRAFTCRAAPGGRGASCRIRKPHRGIWFASVRALGTASEYRVRAGTGRRMRKLP
jgi:hypothetical protein